MLLLPTALLGGLARGKCLVVTRDSSVAHALVHLVVCICDWQLEIVLLENGEHDVIILLTYCSLFRPVKLFHMTLRASSIGMDGYKLCITVDRKWIM